MFHRLWVSLRRDSLINLRNHYLTVVVLVALIYLVFAKLLVPADTSLKPDVYLVDRTPDGLFATWAIEESQKTVGSEKVYWLENPEELRQRMEGNQNSVGVVVDSGEPLPSVTLYFQAHHNDKVRNLLAASTEGQLRKLYGQPWPDQTPIQQQSLRGQGSGEAEPLNRMLVPIFLFSDAVLIGLIFIAALIFMEKEEGTLMAYLVTPGRAFEYLLSKAIAMALLAAVFTLILVPPMLGSQPHYPMLLAVMVLGSIFSSLLGAWIGIYFENFTQFLFPAIGLMLVLGLPAVAYMAPSFSPIWMQWLPTYPLAFALRETLFPAGSPQIVYSALGLLLAMIALLLGLGSWAFRRQLAKG